MDEIKQAIFLIEFRIDWLLRGLEREGLKAENSFTMYGIDKLYEFCVLCQR